MEESLENGPSVEETLKLIRGELSEGRRWIYRILLVCAFVVTGVVLSIWATEPRPLPPRLHFSFGAMVCIGLVWIGLFVWLLVRRNVTSILDELATSWAATFGSVCFLVVAVPISILRGTLLAQISLAVVGFVLLVACILLLIRAYRKQARLRLRLKQLELS